MIAQETIDKVFDYARVEEVIGEFVQLKKTGANYKGLSPFSEENTPSFVVSPVKGIWKDFSTGKGGNSVTFLMESEHLSYPEAIKYLAKKYNIEIEETKQSQEQIESNNKKENLYLVSEFAKKYFNKILLEDKEGMDIGLSYFKERGFTQQTIDAYELGYSPNKWTALTDAAVKGKWNEKHLIEVGLTIAKEEKRFDRFKGRVMFPIHSMSGRVQGFGGRKLANNTKAAKYLNSPESEIYHKSNILYGLFQAKQTIAKEDNCYLVEGYTDVLALHQAGIKNVVSSSGTALTDPQIRLINRLTNNITVLYDGDAAGVRASIRGVDLILAQDMRVRVLTFPDGDDPDSFSKKVSKQELKDYLDNNSQDFINFKASLLLNEAKNDPVKKANLIKEIVVSISKIPNTIQREVYIKQCSSVMDISENVLFTELEKIVNRDIKDYQKKEATMPMDVVPMEYQEQPKSPLYIHERKLLSYLLLYGNEEVVFKDFISEKNKDGEVELKEQKYKSTVIREIYLQLQDDEMEFSDDLFQSIYVEIMKPLIQGEDFDEKKLTNNSDIEIAKEVSSIILEDEKHIISDWGRKEVMVPDKKKNLNVLVMDIILSLRMILISLKIKEISKDLVNNDIEGGIMATMEVIRDYTELKKNISNKLGRTI